MVKQRPYPSTTPSGPPGCAPRLTTGDLDGAILIARRADHLDRDGRADDPRGEGGDR